MNYSLYYNFHKVADIKIPYAKIGFIFKTLEYGEIKAICTYKHGLRNKLYIHTIDLEPCFRSTLEPDDENYCGECTEVPKHKQKEFIEKWFLVKAAQYNEA